jgi:hypothetical protein
LLKQDERRGIVEHLEGGRWRLSTEAEKEYGAALSCLSSDA